ncbi:MAG: hypothetical protein QM723_15090 [Myxococcaceae bacterium]
MTPSPAPAQCAVHPEAPSAGTCERCGRFFCEACRIGPPRMLCRECGVFLTGPEGVAFKPFNLGNALTGGFSLLGATFGRVMLANLPFAIAGGAAAMAITLATGAAAPLRGNAMETLYRVYGATLLLTVYSGLVSAVGIVAGVAVMSAAVSGERIGAVEAWRRAFKIFGRVVGANLLVIGQVFVFSLLCGIPGIWKMVNLSLTNIALIAAPGERPLAYSESLVQPRFWPVLGALLIGAMITIVPIDVVVTIVGAVLRVKFLPAGSAAAISGFGTVFARALFAAFSVSIFYGIRAGENAQR